MKLYCKTCNTSEGLFSAVADVNEVREIESSGAIVREVSSETVSMDFFLHLPCGSDNVEDVDDGREEG